MSAFGSKLRRLDGGKVGFWCPGCKCAHWVGVEAPATVIWGFNGNGDAPTFTPSILVQHGRNNGVCHSFVTDGRIQFLGDCTHALAGQAFDLPDFMTAAQGKGA